MRRNWKLFVFFITTLVICSMSFSLVNAYLAKSALSRDAESLLFDFHETLLNAHKVLDRQSLPDQNVCSEDTLEQLSLEVYHHASIRMLGFAENGLARCVTEGPKLNLSQYTIHKISKDLKLVAAKKNSNLRNELLLVKEDGSKQIFASLSPFLIGHLEESRCSECISYKVTVKGDPDLVFESRSIDSPYTTSSVSRNEGPLDVTLQLSSSKEFYNSYARLSIFSALGISCVIASVLTTLLYRFLSVRQSFSNALKEAINNSEFIPYYQPIVDSRTNETIGAEVLVRWIKPDGSVIPPYQFIPYAEDSGLIVPITNQLITKVIKDIVALDWNSGAKFMSINVVPEHLTNDDLYKRVVELCESNHISAKAISLEITERLEIPDLERAKSALDCFYQYGIDLKLDDAGTGYGGFAYVQELGIQTIKIDKMFVDTIETTDVKNSVLDAIISFAKTSNLDAIAEGVESEAQVAYLKRQGIYKIQGYVYAKPMPIDELNKWLASQE